MNWEYVKEKDRYIITFDNGKKYFVKENVIDNLQKNLKISEFEGIEMWLEDNDIITNVEQEELDKKAKANKVKNVVKSESTEKKKVTRERKPNPIKENIIENLANCLRTIATDVNIENVGKIITFKIENKEFKLDLTEKRVKKV